MDSHLPQKRLSDGFLDRIRWPKKPEILPRLGLKHNSDEADLWGRKTVLTFGKSYSVVTWSPETLCG